MTGAQLVASVDKMTLFLIGGTTTQTLSNYNLGTQDSIYRLQCSNRQCQWSKHFSPETGQQIPVKYNIVAGVIPDELIHCQATDEVVPYLNVYDYIDYYTYYDYLHYNNMTHKIDMDHYYDYDYAEENGITDVTMNKNIFKAWFEEVEVISKVNTFRFKNIDFCSTSDYDHVVGKPGGSGEEGPNERVN